MADTNIAYQIQRIQGNINNAYSACLDKGATMPATNNSALLADTINSITTGGGGYQEVGMYMIDANGVAVPQAGDIDGRFTGITSISNSAMGSAFKNTNITGEANFCNCVNVGYNSLASAFSMSNLNVNNPNCLTGVNFCSLINADYGSFTSAFTNKNFENNAEINFCNLVNISSWTFYHAFWNSLKNNATVNFSNLKIAYTDSFNYAFVDCGGIKTINFNSLENVSGGYYGNSMSYAFSSCGIIELSFPSLTTIESNLGMANCFYNNQDLTNAYFPLLNHVNRMGMAGTFNICSNLKTITIGTNQIIQNCLHLDMTNAKRYSQATGIFQYAFNGTGIERAILKVPENTTTSSYGYFSDACTNCANLVSGQLYITNKCDVSDYGSVFSNCKNLSSLEIYVQGLNSYVANNVFSNCVYGCSNLSTININFLEEGDSGAVSLRNNAFRYAFSNSKTTGVYVNINGNITGTGEPFNLFINGCNTSNVDLRNVDITLSGDIFANMLAGTDGCTIKFNSAEQSTIEGWASYTANFGGTNVTVSFE